MRFTKSNIERLTESLTKIERFFAYKYLVERAEIGIVVRSGVIHIMVEGKLKEKFLPQSLEGCEINESLLEVTKGKY